MPHSLSLVQNRPGVARPNRGPRRVRRNPEDSLRALANDLANAEEMIDSLTMSEAEAWSLAEEARKSTREIISILSHELRTPLQAIFGYAELLGEGIHGALNSDQLTDVNRIQESQHLLLNLLNSVLMRVRTERLAAPDSTSTTT